MSPHRTIDFEMLEWRRSALVRASDL